MHFSEIQKYSVKWIWLIQILCFLGNFYKIVTITYKSVLFLAEINWFWWLSLTYIRIFSKNFVCKIWLFKISISWKKKNNDQFTLRSICVCWADFYGLIENIVNLQSFNDWGKKKVSPITKFGSCENISFYSKYRCCYIKPDLIRMGQVQHYLKFTPQIYFLKLEFALGKSILSIKSDQKQTMFWSRKPFHNGEMILIP